MRYFLILSVLLGLSGCAGIKTDDEMNQDMLSLDMAHFLNSVTTSDDDLDVVATISTFEGYRPKRLGMFLKVDNFLRALIDKKTGEVVYQVYNRLHYQADDWRFYFAANFRARNDVKSVDLSLLKRDVRCTSSKCVYSRDTAFNVPSDLVESLADEYRSKNRHWQYKLVAKNGPDHHDVISLAEWAALYAAVESYKRERGF